MFHRERRGLSQVSQEYNAASAALLYFPKYFEIVKKIYVRKHNCNHYK
jgi:hypothetical protein